MYRPVRPRLSTDGAARRSSFTLISQSTTGGNRERRTRRELQSRFPAVRRGVLRRLSRARACVCDLCVCASLCAVGRFPVHTWLVAQWWPRAWMVLTVPRGHTVYSMRAARHFCRGYSISLAKILGAANPSPRPPARAPRAPAPPPRARESITIKEFGIQHPKVSCVALQPLSGAEISDT